MTHSQYPLTKIISQIKILAIEQPPIMPLLFILLTPLSFPLSFHHTMKNPNI